MQLLWLELLQKFWKCHMLCCNSHAKCTFCMVQAGMHLKLYNVVQLNLHV